MRISLKETRLGLRNSTTRIPFRYGAACLTKCPQAVLKVVIDQLSVGSEHRERPQLAHLQPLVVELATASASGPRDEQLAALLRDCVAAKKPGHGIDSPDFLKPQRAMYQIGG